ANNLKQIGLAVHNFHGNYGFLVPTTVAEANAVPANLPQVTGPDGYVTWATLLLPFIEQDNIYRLWDLKIQCSRQVPAASQQTDKPYLRPSRPAPVPSIDDFPQRIANRPDGGAIGDYNPNMGTINGVNKPEVNDGPIIEASQTFAQDASGFTIVTQWRGRLN